MTTRDRTVLMVVGLIAMVAGFWFLLLAPKRADVASLRDGLVAAQARLDTADSSARQATAAKLKYAADYRAVAGLGKAVPGDDDVPSLVYQLQEASRRSRIQFDSIKLSPGPAAAAPAVAATPAAQVAGLAQEQGKAPAVTGPTGPAGPASPVPAPATVAVAAAQTAFAGLPPGAVVGPAGLPTMPFDFEFSGPFLRLEQLLRRIDAFTKTSNGVIRVNGRLMTIDSIGLSGFPTMKATVHATAFLVPDAQGLLAGATPAGPGTAVPAVAGGTPGAAVPAAVTAPVPAPGATP